MKPYNCVQTNDYYIELLMLGTKGLLLLVIWVKNRSMNQIYLFENKSDKNYQIKMLDTI